MAIMLYSGTPGSYKSYHAVIQCLNAFRFGRNLITNFPLNYKKRIKKPIKGVYECVNNLELTVDYLIDFAVKHHKPSVHAQTLVVIDEASIKFNSRDFNMKDRMGWINFFANHRHFNFDVILITQQDRMLDRQIRGLIETEFKHYILHKSASLCLLFSVPVLHRVTVKFDLPSVTVDFYFVERTLKLCKFTIRKLHLACSKVFQNPLLILGARNRYDIRIFAEHPRQGYLRIRCILFGCVLCKQFNHRLIRFQIFARQLRHEFSHIIDMLKACLSRHLAGKKTARHR